MTPQDHVPTKFSQYDYQSLKDKTKAELLGNLKRSSMDMSVVKGERVCELQGISYESPVSVTNIIRKERMKL